MKKRIISTLITAGLAFTAMTGVFHSVNVIASGKNTIAVEDVTDWNTNGTELAISLSDGTEVYAYKSENVYKPERIQYIATGNIVDVQNTDTGFTIICADGSGYYFKK